MANGEKSEKIFPRFCFGTTFVVLTKEASESRCVLDASFVSTTKNYFIVLHHSENTLYLNFMRK